MHLIPYIIVINVVNSIDSAAANIDLLSDYMDYTKWDNTVYVGLFVGFWVLAFIIFNIRADYRKKRIQYLRERHYELRKLQDSPCRRIPMSELTE